MTTIDPRLRNTIKRAVRQLDDQDFAGIIIAVSKTHVEFRMNFPRRWGALNLEGDQLRFRCLRENYKSVEDQRTAMEESLHIIYQFRDILKLNFDWISTIIGEVEKQFDVDHEPFHGFYPADKE